jgi:hypothetical protein
VFVTWGKVAVLLSMKGELPLVGSTNINGYLSLIKENGIY